MNLLKTVFATVPILLTVLSPLGARSINNESNANDVPQRIVQVGASAFIVENALYLFPEAVDRVVAISDGNQGRGMFVEDIDPKMAKKTVLPRRVNVESVLAEKPDLVVMKNFMKTQIGESLERVDVPTLYLNLESPEAWFQDIDTLGTIFGNPQRAEEVKKFFRESIANATDPLLNLGDKDKPKVLFLYWSVRDGENAVNVPPVQWIQTRMVNMAGGVPVWQHADTGKGWNRINIEQVAAWNPDVIVVASYHTSSESVVSRIQNDSSWQSLDAVSNNRIHAFPSDYYSWDQPDARWLLGLAWLAQTLHPDRFESVDIRASTRRFYSVLYDMDDEQFNTLVEPRLIGLK